MNTNQISQQDKLLKVLRDGQWHGRDEISTLLSFRFGDIIHQLREQGHEIHTKRTKDNRYEYRLLTSALQRVTCNPHILNGRPTIREHPLAVDEVLGKLASGETYESLHTTYHWLEPEDIEACLLYAKRAVLGMQPELTLSQVRSKIPQVIEQSDCLRLLILFGSRAREDADFNSDWDFAVGFDQECLKTRQVDSSAYYQVWRVLQEVLCLSDEKIDVVDLHDSSPLLAHRISEEGKILYESCSGEFEIFKKNHLQSSDQIKQLRNEVRQDIAEKLKGLNA